MVRSMLTFSSRVSEGAGERRIGGVAGVVESLVARDLPAVGSLAHEAESEGRDQRGDAAVGDPDEELTQRDQPKALRRDEGDGSNSGCPDRASEQTERSADAVDKRSDRRVCQEPGEASEAGCGGGEALLLQVDAEERAEALSRACQGEVQGEKARRGLHTNLSEFWDRFGHAPRDWAGYDIYEASRAASST